jgi:hypothetical protein
MKNLFAIAAFTLLASTAWADADSMNSKGGMDQVHKHAPASQMMDNANCNHTHPMGGASDTSETEFFPDGG